MSAKVNGYQPQQSVLKRQLGQRQTACIRYISAPHRSHRVVSGAAAGGDDCNAETIGVIFSSGVGLGSCDTRRL